ncbi:hypothetical protein F441_00219, partial [Phytophthora nicotianae CJ01A1]
GLYFWLFLRSLFYILSCGELGEGGSQSFHVSLCRSSHSRTSRLHENRDAARWSSRTLMSKAARIGFHPLALRRSRRRKNTMLFRCQQRTNADASALCAAHRKL